jgi:hypothetical protein
MTPNPKDRLRLLQDKIDQQRNTIEALKRDGHETKDANRHLEALVAELAMTLPRMPAVKPPDRSGRENKPRPAN